MRCSGFERYI